MASASGKPLPDVLAPDLDILFCGINPSLMSAARGHHFARPGNRFWPALHLAGLTPRRLSPDEDRELLRYGIGVTNIVARPTRAADELTRAELREGATALAELVARFRPRVLAVLGITAWRTAFERPKATIGRQPERVGDAETWVAPNPSGLNAHHQLPDLARWYAELRGLPRSARERASRQGDPVEVAPLAALAQEPAAFVLAPGAPPVLVVGAELDDPLGHEQRAATRGEHLQPGPAEPGVEAQGGRPRVGVPGGQQMIGVSDGERGVARAHQQLRGRGRGGAVEQWPAALGEGTAGSTGAGEGRHPRSVTVPPVRKRAS